MNIRWSMLPRGGSVQIIRSVRPRKIDVSGSRPFCFAYYIHSISQVPTVPSLGELSLSCCVCFLFKPPSLLNIWRVDDLTYVLFSTLRGESIPMMMMMMMMMMMSCHVMSIDTNVLQLGWQPPARSLHQNTTYKLAGPYLLLYNPSNYRCIYLFNPSYIMCWFTWLSAVINQRDIREHPVK